MTFALVVFTIDLRSSLKQDGRNCGAAAKNKILSAKFWTEIAAEQQAALSCRWLQIVSAVTATLRTYQ
jgi:hypothetical protein